MFFEENGEGRSLIVFDLEWNQSSYTPNHRMPHEIIEIGACRVDAQGRVCDTFSRMIRPKVYKKLDKHIRSVTGITEEELSAGGAFAEVFADFCAWCGAGALLVTWGRDDYPVLRRNAAFFAQPMPLEPPIDAQLVFGHACLGDAHQQMNLHSALEHMQISPDVPAHRAVYDAQCTAALLSVIEEAVRALEPESLERLAAILDKERRVAASALRSVPTRCMYQTQALADAGLMAVACPACGAKTRFDTPWFDSGRERYLALAVCPEHGMACAQMHFKRAQSGLLIMHQRAFAASEEEIADVHERYRAYQLTPPRRRHHRLNMEDAVQKEKKRSGQTQGVNPSGKAENDQKETQS